HPDSEVLGRERDRQEEGDCVQWGRTVAGQADADPNCDRNNPESQGKQGALAHPRAVEGAPGFVLAPRTSPRTTPATTLTATTVTANVLSGGVLTMAWTPKYPMISGSIRSDPGVIAAGMNCRTMKKTAIAPHSR